MILARLIALAVALVVLLPAAPVSAADLDDYRASIAAASDALSGGDVEQALDVLRAVEPVELDDGTTISPNLSHIINALEADPPDVEAAQAGLDSVIAALDTAGNTDAIDSDDARATLDDVLARDEFQPEPEDDSESIGQRILGAVNDLFTWFFESLDQLLGGSGGEGSPASVVLAILGVAVVVGIVAFAVRSVRQAMTPGVTRLAEGNPEEHYTSAQARAEAERLFAGGEYRAALRLLYLATLIRWEEAGRLRFDRSLTNREVVARVNLQGDAALLEQLTPLVDRFDRVWYGGAPCTSDDYASFARMADRAWEAA